MAISEHLIFFLSLINFLLCHQKSDMTHFIAADITLLYLLSEQGHSFRTLGNSP
jgi:hypothetical protein